MRRGLDVQNALHASGVPGDAIDLVADLQRVHDAFGLNPQKDWPHALTNVALKHGLQP